MEDKIKKRIQELCPDIVGWDEPLITLAVVLRATDKAKTNQVSVDQWGWMTCGQARGFWHLEHDNYDAQSQETKDFIGSLLDVK